MLPAETIAWPLLAKTVLIQSQWPELYQVWRQFPTLIQTLEEECARRPMTDQEMILKRPLESPAERSPESTSKREQDRATAQAGAPVEGGVLAPFLNKRQEYAQLFDLLAFPEEAGEGRLRARFSGLDRATLRAYLGLAGAAEQEARPVEVQFPADLLSDLQTGDPVKLREALARTQELEADPNGPAHLGLKRSLLQVAHNSELPAAARANAADSLDELGWQPNDLYQFVHIPAQTELKPPLKEFWIGKYPVTNIQYERFLKAENFTDESLWTGFPKYGKDSQPIPGEDWGDKPWIWLQEALNDSERSPDGKIAYPRYWHDPRFGIARKTVPVVGVTWYEAMAYCRWLARNWGDLEEGTANAWRSRSRRACPPKSNGRPPPESRSG